MKEGMKKPSSKLTVGLLVAVLSVSLFSLIGGLSASAATEIIVDNPAATFVGSWPTSTYYSGYYGANYQYNLPGTGTDACTWWFTIPTTGQYTVYAWWAAASNKASNAPYIISTGTTTSTVMKDQRSNGGSWQLLGTYTFSAGSRYVRLTDNANAEVVADAIRVVEYVPPVTSVDYISIPFAAFVPANHGTPDPSIYYHDRVQYSQAYGIQTFEGNQVLCIAPVNLPHGAVVKNVTFYFYYDGASAPSEYEFSFRMWRITKTSAFDIMAAVDIFNQFGVGYTSLSDTTIGYATIDNKNYAYVLAFIMPHGGLNPDDNQFKFATIEYTPP